MKVSVEHLGGAQFEITARQHRIACDQPRENDGFDEGMTLPELLLASLGSCVGFYAAQYLKKHELATEGTKVLVTAEKAKNPPRMDDFQVEVEIPTALNDEQRAGVEEAIRHCLIHNTLLHAPRISFAMKSVALQSA
ncbi:MAG TPA: OsmC family protein [Candidatus Angelobacter sp.]